MTEFEIQQGVRTWADIRPTRISTDYIVKAREDYLQAWGDFDKLVDRKIDGEHIAQDVLDVAQDAACDLEMKYHKLYRLWDDSRAECTCNERHDCAACQAKANLTAALVAGGYSVEIPY